MICTRCGESDYQKRGTKISLTGISNRYQCKRCGGWTFNNEPDKEISRQINLPKILIFDIETSYLETIVWNLGKQYVGKAQIQRDWHLISWSAKWLYEKEVFSDILSPNEAKKGNDKRVAQSLWNIIDSADIIISYNGNHFDIPKSNTRFILNGLHAPSPYKSVDVYQTISSKFDFSSKALDFVNMSFGLGRKLENSGLPLWRNCIAGKSDALQEMVTYNRQDVVCLEETYLRVLPWISNHPNIGLWHTSNTPCCGYCGNEELELLNKKFQTPSGLYESFRCKKCGGVGRANVNLIEKSKRKNLLKSI